MFNRSSPWRISVVASVLLVGACGKKEEATPSGTKAVAETSAPAAKAAALPAGFKDEVDADALAKAAAWARKAPADVAAIEGLRIPGGGRSETFPIDTLIFYATQYPDTSPRQALLGFLVLCAEKGWSVERLDPADTTPVFRVRKGDKIYRVIIGAPKALPNGSALTILYGPGGKGVRPGVPANVEMAVSSPSALSGKMYPGKLKRIYGEYGYVAWNNGGGNWAALDDTEPPLEPAPEPTDPDCDLPAGTPVRSPFGSVERTKLYKGTVLAVYHQLVYVKFDDGKKSWAECADIKQ